MQDERTCHLLRRRQAQLEYELQQTTDPARQRLIRAQLQHLQHLLRLNRCT